LAGQCGGGDRSQQDYHADRLLEPATPWGHFDILMPFAPKTDSAPVGDLTGIFDPDVLTRRTGTGQKRIVLGIRYAGLDLSWPRIIVILSKRRNSLRLNQGRGILRFAQNDQERSVVVAS
jgi:hypothetical protein